MSEAITTAKVVSIHYTLKNDEGEILDASERNDPMLYLHGASNIVPGLERQLEGKRVGDAFDVVVPPEEGYGEREGPGPQAVPKAAFGDAELEPGMSFVIEDEAGDQQPFWVVEVTDEHVLVDGNHPLAGETLHFAVEVMAVRDATEEELAHGHVHEHGHHH